MATYRLSAAERQTYRRYASLALPRHTSYPIATVWRDDYGPSQFRADLARRRDAPLSLYVHVPFCERLCYYCSCTKEIISASKRRTHDPAHDLLEGLELEACRLAEYVGARPFRQVHLGGGSPTFLSPDQLARLLGSLRARFAIAADAEIAIEVDPRVTTREHLETLRQLGCNRISLGIQDFDPRVQRAVNRIQPFALVAQFVSWCRSLGFQSLNFDLIYGLPYQTLDTMADTLERTIELAPDRIAFYRLAVIPEIFRWQNVFQPDDLPSGDLSLDLNLLAINRFLAAGYEFVGLDHFARPDEALARAHQDGSLRRTFQGMTTGQGFDVLGIGPSAISQLDAALAQNAKGAAEWRRAVAQDLATVRGIGLDADDRLRRDLLQELYCYGTVTKARYEDKVGKPFDDIFAREIGDLAELAQDGLVSLTAEDIRLTAPLGRLLVRVVAAVFDRYLPSGAFRDGLAAQLASRVG
jgi:oxygen-independent coproporphyrinogen-3 oxidase